MILVIVIALDQCHDVLYDVADSISPYGALPFGPGVLLHSGVRVKTECWILTM